MWDVYLLGISSTVIFLSWAHSYHWLALIMLVFLMTRWGAELLPKEQLKSWLVMVVGLAFILLIQQFNHVESPYLWEYSKQGGLFVLGLLIAYAVAKGLLNKNKEGLFLTGFMIAALLHLILFLWDDFLSKHTLNYFIQHPEMIKEYARVGRKNVSASLAVGFIAAMLGGQYYKDTRWFYFWMFASLVIAVGLGLMDTRFAYFSLFVAIIFFVVWQRKANGYAALGMFTKGWGNHRNKNMVWMVIVFLSLILLVISADWAGYKRYHVFLSSVNEGVAAAVQLGSAGGKESADIMFNPRTFSDNSTERVVGNADPSSMLRIGWIFVAAQAVISHPIGYGVHANLIYQTAQNAEPSLLRKDVYQGGLHSTVLNFMVMFGVGGMVMLFLGLKRSFWVVWKSNPKNAAQVGLVLCFVVTFTRLLVDQFDYALTISLAIQAGWMLAIAKQPNTYEVLARKAETIIQA